MPTAAMHLFMVYSMLKPPRPHIRLFHPFLLPGTATSPAWTLSNRLQLATVCTTDTLPSPTGAGPGRADLAVSGTAADERSRDRDLD
ncbi:hypothetical protein CALCODRAFT_4365 [Calocera cornea HHB12733]|uniref:Uncharacterized protein n=1 Tax=Calocera cornea HHB12733 TaxID=1353952 RepID=A0A165KAS8_9BASI|nr:hypothetical protein CALCODRAFT_4365 [Calocera cornea HHB12733]